MVRAHLLEHVLVFDVAEDHNRVGQLLFCVSFSRFGRLPQQIVGVFGQLKWDKSVNKKRSSLHTCVVVHNFSLIVHSYPFRGLSTTFSIFFVIDCRNAGLHNHSWDVGISTHHSSTYYSLDPRLPRILGHFQTQFSRHRCTYDTQPTCFPQIGSAPAEWQTLSPN